MAPNSNPQVFLFLSQVLGKKILDTTDRKWGRVLDLIVSVAELYPLVMGVLYRPLNKQALLRFTWERVQEVGHALRIDPLKEGDSVEGVLKEGEVLLKESLLDKQIVDTHGAKILRVNDLHLLRVNSSLRLVHVDVGLRGLMRRVGLERATEKFFQWFFDYQLTDTLIPWRVV